MYAVDEIVRFRDHYFWCVNVDVLAHFKEVLLESLRNAQAKSQPWHWHELSPNERLARSEADGLLNRLRKYFDTSGQDMRGGP